MKLVTLLVTLAIVPSSQVGTTSVVGSWTAQFEGTTFVRLELNTADGGITGGIRLGNFELDDRGAVRRVSALAPGLTPIFDVTQRGSTLMFSIKEGDDEPDRFEFRLLEGGRAELRLLLNEADREELAASGIQPLRPILLTKQ